MLIKSDAHGLGRVVITLPRGANPSEPRRTANPTHFQLLVGPRLRQPQLLGPLS
jgi:hypothetical protein